MAAAEALHRKDNDVNHVIFCTYVPTRLRRLLYDDRRVTSCRWTVLAAAEALDRVGSKEARGQIAAAKVND